MYVFHYDSATGAYKGSDKCEFDQLEPGKILVPAWATSEPFPTGSLEVEGRWPFFIDGKWQVLDVEPAPAPEPEPEAAPAAPILGETVNLAEATDDEKRAAAALFIQNAQRLLDELKAAK